MNIGLVYDLRKAYLKMGFTDEETAEFDSEVTVDSIDDVLSSLGHDVVRIGNIYELTSRLSLGERWDLVFNISEGLYGRSREAQVPALLEAYNIPYTFSDPLTLAVCLDKAMTKIIVRNAGIPTAEFFVVKTRNALMQMSRSGNLTFPLFAKPCADGTSKGISGNSIIADGSRLATVCTDLLKRFRQPVLVEQYLPGREFTVGIVGTGSKAKAIGVLEITLKESAEPFVYSYLNKQFFEQRVVYHLIEEPALAAEISALAVKAYNALDCRDAGRVDLKADADGRVHFLEINPLAGLNPVRSDLPILCQRCGIPYNELIAGIITSASERIRHGAQKPVYHIPSLAQRQGFPVQHESSGRL